MALNSSFKPSRFAVVRKIVVLIAFFLLSACSYGVKPKIPNNNCPEPQGLPEGKLLLIGEMHGSVEAPELISRLACFLSKSQEIAVGLEVPSNDQSLIDSYLISEGTNTDLQKLASSDFWQTGRDGRSSSAMLNLIESIRKLKKEGHSINLFAFDDQPGTALERNVAIANGIRRFHVSHPNAKIIALMGNLHAMKDPMLFDGKELIPSGSLLKDLHPASIFVAYPAGTIWACMPRCETQALNAVKDMTGAPGFKDGSPIGGYTHTYLLPSVTASPPAAQ